jgi:hypothetical protein
MNMSLPLISPFVGAIWCAAESDWRNFPMKKLSIKFHNVLTEDLASADLHVQTLRSALNQPMMLTMAIPHVHSSPTEAFESLSFFTE